MSARRCACGRSTTFPRCDGSHQEEGWTCEAASGPAALALLAGDALLSFAERLGHRCRAPVVGEVAVARAQRLVVLSDGHDVPALRLALSAVEAARIEIIGIGVPEGPLRATWPSAACVYALPDLPLARLWPLLERALDGELAGVVEAPPPPRIFLSHAVADEAQLFPAVAMLREHLSLDVFVCADSLPPGSRWLDRLLDELRARERLIYVHSKAAACSQFCAFELGMARALGKPIRVLSLDGAPPPAFVQDLQASDLPRLARRKPWLEGEALVFDGLMACLSDQ